MATTEQDMLGTFTLNSTYATTTEVQAPYVYRDFTQITWVYAVLLTISILIIVTGVIGNGMAITVILKRKSMRTPTNFYILSLAVSDLCVTAFVMPVKITQLISNNVKITPQLCKFVEFLMPFFVFTSIWTLVSISVDRYLVIIHPLKSRSFNTTSRALRNLLIIWIVPLFILFPNLIFPWRAHSHVLSSELGSLDRVVCQQETHMFEAWFWIERVVLVVMMYLLPVGILAFTCGSIARRLLMMTEDDKILTSSMKKDDHGRRKVAKMVLVVVLAFWICWTPFFAVTWLQPIIKFLSNSNFFFVNIIVFTCGFFNSTLNPILYALMSQAFRRGFWEIITCCCPRVRYLYPVGKRGCGRNQSMTVTSQTENTAMSNSEYGGHRRRKQLHNEATQVTNATNSDDEMCLKKISGNNNNSLNSKTSDPTEGDMSHKREQLLNKLLDDNAMCDNLNKQSNDTNDLSQKENQLNTEIIQEKQSENKMENVPLI